MRQQTGHIRQAQALSVGASSKAGRGGTPLARMLIRSGAIALVGGLFLAVSAAFQTGDIPFPQRAAYWVGLLSLGTVVNRGVDAWAGGSAIAITRPLLFTLVSFVGSTVVLTPVVVGVTWWAYGGGVRPGTVPYIALAVMLVSAVMTGVNMLAERQPRLTHAEPPSRPQPAVESGGAPTTAKLIARLPARLQGGELCAIQAEDHYLRLYTSRGSDLILMRFSDALSELAGIEGAQVHRSWWVARAAVAAAQRTEGRAVLTLPSGETAPVSRTYVKALRDAGWL